MTTTQPVEAELDAGMSAQDRLAGWVAAGALFLDAQWPGWTAWIDAVSLSMQSGYFCVLGQIAKHEELGRTDDGESPFDAALRHSGRGRGWATEHGFDLVAVVDTWDQLDRLWLDEIERRRAL